MKTSETLDTLAIVKFPGVAGRPAEALLGLDLNWTMADAHDYPVEMWTLTHLPAYSPSDGVPGMKIANEAAEKLGGTAEWPGPDVEYDPGVIY